MGASVLRSLGAVVEAGAGHSFTKAALFYEVLFQAADLFVQKVVCLMDEAEGDVGDYGGGRVAQKVR